MRFGTATFTQEVTVRFEWMADELQITITSAVTTSPGDGRAAGRPRSRRHEGARGTRRAVRLDAPTVDDRTFVSSPTHPGLRAAVRA